MTSILIVDDLEQNVYMLRILLQGYGYEIISATNGQQALEIAQQTPPDMIVTDILMPVMDGFTLCRKWRKDDLLKDIPFVFYTATYTDEKDKQFALSLGADHFLIKPMEPEPLVQELRTIYAAHLAKREGEKTAVSPPISTSTTSTSDSPTEEKAYFQQYNQTLIRKLEDKMMQLELANGRLSTLYKVSNKLASIKLYEKSVAHVLRTVINTLGYPTAEYFAYDKATETLSLIEKVGQLPVETTLHQTILHVISEESEEKEGPISLTGEIRSAFIINDTQKDSRWVSLDKQIQAALIVPVSYEKELLGVINFPSLEPDAFNQEDAKNAMTLANNIAVALENARLYAEQRQYATRLEEEVKERTVDLTLALEKAQEADRLKSQFVSDVNHELRTPLNNIKLYLNLLEQGRSEKQAHYMTILNQETNRLQVLIENLLDLSRLDADTVAANLLPLDLNQFIGTVIIARMKLVADKGLTLDFNAGKAIPLIQADSQLLFQAVTNLLANAINYTPSGGFVTLQTDVCDKQGQKWATLKVIDSGLGISEDDMARLFERFYRGSGARGTQGTGLGLAICREIMMRHGGEITVESILGEGTTFTLYFPLNR